VICYVLEANPPFEVIDGYVRRIWKAYAIDKVVLVKRGLYLVRFVNYQDAPTMTQKGLYHFDHKTFIVKAWTRKWRSTLTPLLPYPFGYKCQI